MSTNDTGTDKTLTPDEYLEPEAAADAEIKIKRSLFLSHIEPCRDDTTAREILARVQASNHDATHVCWAYVMRSQDSRETLREYSTDAGEPAGTAGRPILGEIKKSGMVNAMVTVTRYFGGVKLGVRGLIEAYGQAAELAVAAARPVRRVLTLPIEISLPYAAIGSITRLLNDHKAEPDTMRWTYTADALVHADVPRSFVPSLRATLDEMAARKIIIAYL